MLFPQKEQPLSSTPGEYMLLKCPELLSFVGLNHSTNDILVKLPMQYLPPHQRVRFKDSFIIVHLLNKWKVYE